MNEQLFFILALIIGLLTGFFIGYMWFTSLSNKEIEKLKGEIKELKDKLKQYNS
jgi:uncharacterized membrane-anchored protein YhcB (DUF1043 family)